MQQYRSQFKGVDGTLFGVIYWDEYQNAVNMEEIFHNVFRKFRHPNSKSEWLIKGTDENKTKTIFESAYNTYCLQFDDELPGELIFYQY
jgi:hypothetical protein